MQEEEKWLKKPVRYRSRSRSSETDRGHHHRRRYDIGERIDTQRDRWEKRRSRSRDTSRKRRSLSPQNDHGYQKDRGEGRSHRRQKTFEGLRGLEARRQRKSLDPDLQPFKRSQKPLPSQQDAFNNEDKSIEQHNPVEKQKPNFKNTGRLAAASNTIEAGGGRSIVLKYHEPTEARKPPSKDAWRMYIFKNDKILDTLQLSEQSCWLFGREAAVVDFLVEHTSCSKQHAVLQFRYIEKKNEFGDTLSKVRPYLIDLESSNGTFVNDEPLPEGRYVELRDKDVVKFGTSTREYVIQLPPAG